MHIKLSENIRQYRKERNMTQEQLAEAMGVSISAVYKWESGQSVPDIQLILGMADLFQISTDVLFGYEWRNRSAASALERITMLASQKDYKEAAAEAERALKRYPNHFDIVYQSALLYLGQGEEIPNRKGYERAVALLEHACELIDQNQNDAISEVSIRTQIAKVYLLLGDTGTALRILKKYNVCGVNNGLIGMVLGDYLHEADQAEVYLGKAFSSFADSINAIMVGYANVFFQRKNYNAAIDCFQWLRVVLRGIQPKEDLTWFDKYECVLLETIAECYYFNGDMEQAQTYLTEAVRKAVRYDRLAPDGIGGMRFFTTLGIEIQPTYESYGKTAMECLRKRLPNGEDGTADFYGLWIKVWQEEAQGYETV